MISKFLAELSNDYKNLFETKIGYDVIIYAGVKPDVKEIHAHSNVLCIRSSYFRSALLNIWAEKKDGKFIFRKPNISPQSFNIILRFIYCGSIELSNLHFTDILELLIAVDELNIHSLIPYIQEFLIEHQTEFLEKNSIEILEIIYQYETFSILSKFCLEKICDEPKILFNSDKFINLKAPLLELLLKSDDLIIDEIEVWENLLKWCCAQQNLENDPTKWSNDDITKVKTIIHQFIPLIRFYNIEPADFYYKVHCYRNILPQDLILDLLEFHVVPDMKPKTNVAPSRKSALKLNSTIIESKHILLFVSWIDKKKDPSHYSRRYIPYDFNLLYHSSLDGFNTTSFHKNCNNKGATIWVAKIKGSTQLIGGYNPLDWNGSGRKNTRSSFLFNIPDGKNISNTKMRFNTPMCAIYCHEKHGPSMGDLYCPDSNIWSYRTSKNIIGIPAKFVVEEYEVFQVVKKQLHIFP
ncbi:hypothetical protein RclHR1_17360005 [Rhizophagus clarus]|uniref:BTB domain-containing protein n=1 Tax=Rhizophagus clarus TaxID=94130 RepID=A0A2Z6QXB0_9GLOM|nr:hypothetical protein RclHR1_17360005 [Rhizophagus clarus]GES80963.1 hypothetical protein GLOIN_2v1763871 [Rhizophagus clarus]